MLELTLIGSMLLAATQRPEVTLLEFTSDHCPACRLMGPVVRQLEREGYDVVRIDVSRDQARMAQYRVRAIPTFVVLRNGQEVARRIGVTPAAELRRLLGQPRGHASGSAAAQAGRRSPPAATGPPAGRTSQGQLATRSQGALSRQAVWPRQQSAPTSQPADGPSDAELIRRSVRLRMTAGQFCSFATGTIISSRPGETLILTCSHLFDGVGGKRRVQVEFFDSSDRPVLTGELVRRDRQADLALVRVETDGTFPVAPVATRAYRPGSGLPASSVGCDHGADPTVRRTRILAVDRYLGPATIECSSQPVQGRSGGGLFNHRSELVGVCSAADPWLQRGIYAGLRSIHSFLDQAGLAYLYRQEPKLGQPALLAGACDGKVGHAAGNAPAKLAGQKGGRLSLPMPSPEEIGLHVTARSPVGQQARGNDMQRSHAAAASTAAKRESPWQPLQAARGR